MKKITGIILAGGKSSRMGRDKSFIPLGHKELIEVVIDKLRALFEDLIIVTNNPSRYQKYGLRIVTDVLKDCGPMGGIYAGLLASETLYNFAVACDMPNLNLKLIEYMIKQKHGFDAVVPHLKKGYEALFALYSKNCIIPIYEAIKSEHLKVRDFFKKVNVREIKEDEIKIFGDPDILFTNINTPLDYARLSVLNKKNETKDPS